MCSQGFTWGNRVGQKSWVGFGEIPIFSELFVLEMRLPYLLVSTLNHTRIQWPHRHFTSIQYAINNLLDACFIFPLCDSEKIKFRKAISHFKALYAFSSYTLPHHWRFRAFHQLLNVFIDSFEASTPWWDVSWYTFILWARTQCRLELRNPFYPGQWFFQVSKIIPDYFRGSTVGTSHMFCQRLARLIQNENSVIFYSHSYMEGWVKFFSLQNNVGVAEKKGLQLFPNN